MLFLEWLTGFLNFVDLHIMSLTLFFNLYIFVFGAFFFYYFYFGFVKILDEKYNTVVIRTGFWIIFVTMILLSQTKMKIPFLDIEGYWMNLIYMFVAVIGMFLFFIKVLIFTFKKGVIIYINYKQKA